MFKSHVAPTGDRYYSLLVAYIYVCVYACIRVYVQSHTIKYTLPMDCWLFILGAIPWSKPSVSRLNLKTISVLTFCLHNHSQPIALVRSHYIQAPYCWSEFKFTIVLLPQVFLTVYSICQSLVVGYRPRPMQKGAQGIHHL